MGKVDSSNVDKDIENLQPSLNFPVTAIGASAGGLDAIEKFVKAIPTESGIAYVIITHMDPNVHSLLAEILGRIATIAVIEAKDNQQLKPDTMYVMPPGKDMIVEKGVLKLFGRFEERRISMPIDYFLRSLAEDQGINAAAVILSGTGTDGTLGLRAVQASLGTVLAQEPSTALYKGMPESAIATGLVDLVIPPEQMPKRLVEYFHSIKSKGAQGLVSVQEDDVFPRILSIIKKKTGHDFSQYKKTTVNRRIERRLMVHGLKKKSEYLVYLNEHPSEVDMLFKEMLIEVTRFFRDPEAFEVLKKEIMERIISKKEDGSQLRVWVPGCSTGEEAYSTAIVLRELILESHKSITAQIFGTDIDDKAIEVARNGAYSASVDTDVGKERLDKFFLREDDKLKIKKEIREMTIFAAQDVISDPPFIHVDLLICRNLLIYFEPALQKKTIETFLFALEPNGILFLGPSETIDGYSSNFDTLDSKWKVYESKGKARDYHGEKEMELPARRDSKARNEAEYLEPEIPSIQQVAEKTLLSDFSYPAVVISKRGDILLFYGKTGEFLQPLSGKPSLTIQGMIREELRVPVMSALKEASESISQVSRMARIRAKDGGFQQVDVIAKPLLDQQRLNGLIVVFKTQSSLEKLTPKEMEKFIASDKEKYIRDLEKELTMTKETLQTTVEQLEAYNEELRSANEELQSTNEELQSTNEETETAKEELHSLNEELMSVNAELETKNNALIAANSDMRNILSSSQIATIFLNNQFKIKRYTATMNEIMNLIPADLGRPMSDISLRLEEENIEKEASKVLDNLQASEKEVRTMNGHWYNMRIIPYRTLDNKIDGVVITFTNIDSQKRTQTKLRDLGEELQGEQQLAENIIAAIPEPLLVLDQDFRVETANDSFMETFRVSRNETLGHRLFDLGNGQWNIPELRELLEKVANQDRPFKDFIVENDFPGIGNRKMTLQARRVKSGNQGSYRIVLLIESIFQLLEQESFS